MFIPIIRSQFLKQLAAVLAISCVLAITPGTNLTLVIIASWTATVTFVTTVVWMVFLVGLILLVWAPPSGTVSGRTDYMGRDGQTVYWLFVRRALFGPFYSEVSIKVDETTFLAYPPGKLYDNKPVAVASPVRTQ